MSASASLRASAARPGVLAVGLGIVAGALSAAGSWIPSLWGDEATSVLAARRGIPGLLKLIQHVDAVHALYYFGLHWWIQLFGDSAFSIRFPSAVVTGIAVAGVALIGQRLGGTRLAITAGLIAALLPRITYNGEEARSFASTAAIAVWLTLLLFRAIRPGAGRLVWFGYGALLCVGTLLFAYFVLVGVGHGVALVASRAGRRVLTRGAVAVGAGMIGATPILLLGYFERDQISYLADRSELTWQRTGIDMWFGEWWYAVVGWALLALGIVAAWRAHRTAGGGVDHTWLVVGWTMVPVLVLIGTSPLVAGYTGRYLAMCSPGVALLMALGLRMLVRNRRVGLAAGTAVTVALAVPIWAAQRTPYAKNESDWGLLSQRMGELAHPGDGVVFDENYHPSLRPRLSYRTTPAGYRGLVDVTLQRSYLSNFTWYDRAYSVQRAAELGRFDGIDRVWLLEYMNPSTRRVDVYGVRALETLGFHRVAEYRLHSDAILEFARG